MYDKSFNGKRKTDDKYYAVRWKAHDPSNELKFFNMINRAKNYNDYTAAATNLHTPGQNIVFACKNGDIAIRAQGEFPARWKGQGDFVMPGTDSSYMWQGMIPQDEVPFQYNPARGFVSSANQRPVDSTYPYYLGRNYPPYRGFIINRKLNAMNNITPQDMMAMQADNYNVFAEMARPIFLKNIKENKLDNSEIKYFDELKHWNLRNDADSKGATVFAITWDSFKQVVWSDEYAKAPKPIMMPFESTLLEGILKDSAYSFLDNIETSGVETLADDATDAFKKAVARLKDIEADGKLEWAKYKDTHVDHLTKLAPFSRKHLSIGGGDHIINAAKPDHGPSWRMVVQLSTPTEAYGVYPGGQSGNPGSKFYDDFIDNWVAGKYYKLWFMQDADRKDKEVKWTMKFNKGK